MSSAVGVYPSGMSPMATRSSSRLGLRGSVSFGLLLTVSPKDAVDRRFRSNACAAFIADESTSLSPDDMSAFSSTASSKKRRTLLISRRSVTLPVMSTPHHLSSLNGFCVTPPGRVTELASPPAVMNSSHTSILAPSSGTESSPIPPNMPDTDENFS